MNLEAADKIGKAVLYEGYMLYPYRPSSVKNQQRWNFGVVCPQSYSEQQQGTEASTMQTECLVEGDSVTELEIRVRFLQLITRTVGELDLPVSCVPTVGAPQFHGVASFRSGGRNYRPWQEAVEREVVVPARSLAALDATPFSQTFSWPAERRLEYLPGETGTGVIVREQSPLRGTVEAQASAVADGLFKVCVRISNLTTFAADCATSRDAALMSSMVSTHTILGVHGGQFCSLLEPPEHLREVAAACQNSGTWPVLVGEEGQRDTVLSSPIILYDYPAIAPESAGDLFDGTEIDEILSLRIMTLTDDEKREMCESDDRARQMLERTENMPAEQLMKMHGVLRQLRSVREETQ